MKNKKKLIISSIISIIGISILVLGLTTPNTRNNKLNTNNENHKLNDPTIKFDVMITNFTIKRKEKNSLSLSFFINNNNEKEIENTKLYIKFYDKSTLLNTFEYEINNLEINNTIFVESNIDFEFENITKYIFKINDVEKELIPLEIYN